jgi:hypothetical protein
MRCLGAVDEASFSLLSLLEPKPSRSTAACCRSCNDSHARNIPGLTLRMPFSTSGLIRPPSPHLLQGAWPTLWGLPPSRRQSLLTPLITRCLRRNKACLWRLPELLTLCISCFEKLFTPKTHSRLPMRGTAGLSLLKSMTEWVRFSFEKVKSDAGSRLRDWSRCDEKDNRPLDSRDPSEKISTPTNWLTIYYRNVRCCLILRFAPESRGRWRHS